MLACFHAHTPAQKAKHTAASAAVSRCGRVLSVRRPQGSTAECPPPWYLSSYTNDCVSGALREHTCHNESDSRGLSMLETTVILTKDWKRLIMNCAVRTSTREVFRTQTSDHDHGWRRQVHHNLLHRARHFRLHCSSARMEMCHGLDDCHSSKNDCGMDRES